MAMSDSETSSESFVDDLSDIEEEYEEIASIDRERSSQTTDHTLDDVDEGAYQDEPIASDEWVDDYNERQIQIQELESNLKKRLAGDVPVSDWCKCGKCATSTLQNISECYCCTELDECVESLETDIVRQDLTPDTTLACVTDHPGFQPVCLQKWSLRMAADKLKTKEKQRYRQTGSEGRFLRSIAYREFCRLIYGFLGNKRMPLPACAYIAIRNNFPLERNEDNYTGFELDEDI